jgi:hypothetical protein
MWGFDGMRGGKDWEEVEEILEPRSVVGFESFS